MPFNGSGTFNRGYSWTNDAANSINIRADRMDADANDIASALSNCITRDGQGKPSGPMDWNGQNLTNINALSAVWATLTNAPAASDSSTKVPTTAWVGANTPGRLLNVQVFTASGTYTPTAGMKTAIVEVQGGGGGGGGTAATGAGQTAAASGGSAGSYGRGQLTAAQVGASQAITVGTGGAGGAAGANSGTPGGTSSCGALISAPGGNAGAASNAGTSPFIITGPTPGGGATGGSLVNTVGMIGGPGIVSGNAISGYGGGSPIAGGGGGGPSSGPGQNGQPASAKGAGGSGACGTSSDVARAGGAGGSGLVIVWEYA